jgi:hypothetical protein
MGQASPSKNDLPDVRFGSAGIHTVNSSPNIQARGLHILQKGATAHFSDSTRQHLAGGPVP